MASGLASGIFEGLIMGKLTARSASSIVKSGKAGTYGDGSGLSLLIPKEGLPYWMLRYTKAGKRKSMTLGKFEHLTLADARTEAENHKKQIREGIDPLAERKREQQIVIKTVNNPRLTASDKIMVCRIWP
jgi:hypothetical protein